MRSTRPGPDDLPHAEPVGCLCPACQEWALHADDELVVPYRLEAMRWLAAADRGEVLWMEADYQVRRMREHERMIADAARQTGTSGSADPRALRVDFGAVLERLADRCEVRD